MYFHKLKYLKKNVQMKIPLNLNWKLNSWKCEISELSLSGFSQWITIAREGKETPLQYIYKNALHLCLHQAGLGQLKKCMLFCAPCLLITSITGPKQWLSSGYVWRKLFSKLPGHESSIQQEENYLQWRNLENLYTVVIQ